MRIVSIIQMYSNRDVYKKFFGARVVNYRQACRRHVYNFTLHKQYFHCW